MNKLLAITILNLSIFGCNNSVLANDLTCSDDKNSEVIKYSAVEYTKKGAFVLDGSSKGLRSWVIGTPSYLVLDGSLESTYKANCR